MRQTFYIIKNNSGSAGTYLIDNDYKTLFPGEKLTLDKKPVNTTANIIVTIFRKEVGGEKILNKKN